MEYDVLISKEKNFIKINIVDSDTKKDIYKPTFVTYEIDKLTSNAFSVLEQFKPENQVYSITQTYIDPVLQSKTVVENYPKVKTDKIRIKPLPTPVIPDYELVDEEPLVVNADTRQFLTNQYLWINKDKENPEKDELNSDGTKKFIELNTEITLYFSKKIEKDKIVNLDKVNGIVKYTPKINDENFFRQVDKFNEFDNNLFFLAIAQLKDQDTNIVKLPSEEVINVLNYNKHLSKKELIDKVNKTFDKFTSIKERVMLVGNEEQGIRPYQETKVLFQRARIYEDDMSIEFQVSSDFVDLFNNLSTWTRFALNQYIRIHSRYGKKLYRLLKSMRGIGHKRFSVDEFKNLLGISESYTVGNINQRIIPICMEELAPAFRNLQCSREFGGLQNGRGGAKIVGWKFTFTPERTSRNAINSKLYDETIALTNIKSNKWLDQEGRFRAVDRYRGRKLGTTKKMYSHAHPDTIFFPNPKEKNHTGLSRPDLTLALRYSITELKELIKKYEYENAQGNLLQGDINDLRFIEMILFDKELKFAHKTEHREKSYVPIPDCEVNQIALEIIDFEKISNEVYMQKLESIGYKSKIERELQNRLQMQWALLPKERDHRQPEVKSDFWDTKDSTLPVDNTDPSANQRAFDKFLTDWRQ